MQMVTGPGVTHTYVYDAVNKRIVSRDGEKDEFVDFFDGNATEDQLKTLNHWDSDIKRAIKGDLDNFDRRGKYSDEIVFTVEIKDNGDKVWTFKYGEKEHTMFEGLSYPYADYEYETRNRFYQTDTHQDYDLETNSISLAIGDSYEVAGMKFTINQDNFSVRGINDMQEWKRAEPYALALSHLMLFVEGIWGAYAITDEDTQIALDFLRKQGVDTSREFVVNNTHCQLVNGKIQEIGTNRLDDHSSIQKLMQSSLQKSFQYMSKTLA